MNRADLTHALANASFVNGTALLEIDFEVRSYLLAALRRR
jgi:hypothetical protein